jgi:rRNA maturation endonuclease Nob1
MVTLHHICEECTSEFTVKYDEELCDDSPHFCPFCGEMLVETEEVQDEDE